MQIMEVIDRMSERLAVYEAKFAEPEPLPERLALTARKRSSMDCPHER